ncbi:MAG: SufE family protein [Sinomonas sp.]|nr:SufE family protein [Sinomonas sp.]
MTTHTTPAPLAEIIDEFQELEERDRLQLLLEFAQSLPELPERYEDHPERLEQVVECQSPVFITIETEPAEDSASTVVRLFLTAPREAPTTRGFASILFEGLDGLTANEILSVPDDIAHELGLDRAVSPLRLRGMSAMLVRIKRKVAGECHLGQIA